MDGDAVSSLRSGAALTPGKGNECWVPTLKGKVVFLHSSCRVLLKRLSN